MELYFGVSFFSLISFLVCLIVLKEIRLSKKALRCPHCNKKLCQSFDKRKYETGLEHVSPNPFGEIPERHCLLCSNEKCELYNKIFWDEVGDYYLEKPVSREFHSWLRGRKENGVNFEAKNSIMADCNVN
jgi:hypothetical protein